MHAEFMADPFVTARTFPPACENATGLKNPSAIHNSSIFSADSCIMLTPSSGIAATPYGCPADSVGLCPEEVLSPSCGAFFQSQQHNSLKIRPSTSPLFWRVAIFSLRATRIFLRQRDASWPQSLFRSPPRPGQQPHQQQQRRQAPEQSGIPQGLQHLRHLQGPGMDAIAQ